MEQHCPSPAARSRREPALGFIAFVGLIGAVGAAWQVQWMLVTAAGLPACFGLLLLHGLSDEPDRAGPWWRLGQGLIGLSLANLAGWRTFAGSATPGATAAVCLTVGASIILLATGLFGLVDPVDRDHRRHRHHLDAWIVMASSTYAFWTVTSESVISVGRSTPETALLLMGPLGAAATVGAAAFAWSRPAVFDARSARTAAAGLLFIGVGSGLGIWVWSAGHPRLALVLVGMQLFGASLVGVAGIRSVSGSGSTRADAPRLAALLVPLVLTTALGAGGAQILVTRRWDPITTIGFLSLTALALLRQGLALSENQELARSLSRVVERLRHQATHDHVTALPNRLEFIELTAASDRSADDVVTLAILNLDRFQHINDTLGHDAGDALLRLTAQRLRLALSPRDVLGHLGADEFVIARRTDRRADAGLAEHDLSDLIREALSHPVDLGGIELVVKVSIGIAQVDPAAAESAHAAVGLAVQHADLALRTAKRLGRNRTESFEPEMAQIVQRRISLAAELRRALHRQEFEIYYQPLVAFDDRRIVGAEALVRWNHPERGVLTPDGFLDVAEEIGVLTEIGRQSLLESCRRFAVLNRQLTGRPLHVAINQSASELLAPDVVRFVDATLRDAGLDPHLLVLEVSEEIVAEPRTVEVLESLHELGVRLSIDDFGTGYSSLSQLRRFPADEVKIDRSFVTNMVDDPADRTIAETVCQLGRGLGLQVVAEGVETEAQAAVLAELGCDIAQGWLFGRPQPFSRLVAAIRDEDRRAADAATSPGRPPVAADTVQAT